MFCFEYLKRALDSITNYLLLVFNFGEIDMIFQRINLNLQSKVKVRSLKIHRIIVLLVVGLLHTSGIIAQQKTITINFTPIIPLYDITDSLGTKITQFKCYISDFQLLNNEGIVTKPDAPHLIELEDQSTMTWEIAIDTNQSFSSIRFNIGIDSLTNVSGAMGGDLDPTEGMYWTWQSGYINTKIEGYSIDCPTRNNKFNFHLGGYIGENYGLQSVTLPVVNSDNIVVTIDINKFIGLVDLSEEHTVMSPSKRAVELAYIFASTFNSEL